MIESAILILGISILYFGFAAAFGLLLHELIERPGAALAWVLASTFALFIMIPSTMVVFSLTGLPAGAQGLIVIAGLLIASGTTVQPDWLPDDLWQQPIRGGYLALAMGFAALWSINYALTSNSSLTLLLGLASACAAFASARSSLHIS